MSTHATSPVIWTEIPVTSLEGGITFYNAVFGLALAPMDMGGERVAAFGRGSVGGNLVEGPAGEGRGNVIHMAVPDSLEAARDRAQAAGALIDSPEIRIPPGRYVMIRDPFGNRIGLFEPNAA